MSSFIGKFVIFGLLAVIVWPTGEKFGKRLGKTPSREPFTVLDTVRLSNGVGKISLDDRFTATRHSTKPTSIAIFPSVAQVMDNTSDLIHSYGVYIDENLDTIFIYSDSTSDTSKVAVLLKMR